MSHFLKSMLILKKKEKTTSSLFLLMFFFVMYKKNPATTYSPTSKAVPSALRCLTAVFGMGTGVTTLLLSPENLISPKNKEGYNNCVSNINLNILFIAVLIKQYDQVSRSISIGQLNMLPCVHFLPINQIFSLGPLGIL